ncbi:MAG: hypothetical protein ACYCSN_20995 [Acidobacteriaceae bacterium]
MNLEALADRVFADFAARKKAPFDGMTRGAEPVSEGPSTAALSTGATLTTDRTGPRTGEVPDTALGSGWY